MKSYRKELWFEVPSRRAFLNITAEVEAALAESGVREGLVPGQRHAHHGFACSSTTTNAACITITRCGSRSSRRIEPVSELSPQSHRRRQCRRAHEAAGDGPRSGRGDHQVASSTSDPGSRSSTASSTAAAASACW